MTAILTTYSAVLKTLEDVSNESDRDRAIEAVGILHGVKSFNFVVALVIFKKFTVYQPISLMYCNVNQYILLCFHSRSVNYRYLQGIEI